MPSGGAIVFGDLDSKLEMLRVACSKGERQGRYSVANPIERHGRDAKLVDWKEEITAECPKRANRLAVTDLCGPYFPISPRCSDGHVSHQPATAASASTR